MSSVPHRPVRAGPRDLANSSQVWNRLNIFSEWPTLNHFEAKGKTSMIFGSVLCCIEAFIMDPSCNPCWRWPFFQLVQGTTVLNGDVSHNFLARWHDWTLWHRTMTYSCCTYCQLLTSGSCAWNLSPGSTFHKSVKEDENRTKEPDLWSQIHVLLQIKMILSCWLLSKNCHWHKTSWSQNSGFTSESCWPSIHILALLLDNIESCMRVKEPEGVK